MKITFLVLEMKAALSPYVKRFCIGHPARTLHGSHEEVASQMQKHSIEVAFDGYETVV